MTNATKPIICLDFDGVIHSAEGGEIYGTIVEGFFAWAAYAQQFFQLVIYSSRSKTDEGRQEMESWLAEELRKWAGNGEALEFQVSAEKPPAFLTIDDRAICFQGDWGADELLPAKLLNFLPWNQATSRPNSLRGAIDYLKGEGA